MLYKKLTFIGNYFKLSIAEMLRFFVCIKNQNSHIYINIYIYWISCVNIENIEMNKYIIFRFKRIGNL